MLFFFDESFRISAKDAQVSLGALCGIAIPERELRPVAQEVFLIKKKHFGAEFAHNGEIKGKELLKNWVFRLAEQDRSRNLALAADLLDCLAARRLAVFGCVCFEQTLRQFQVNDVTALDKTFRYLFERVDTWMKIRHRDGMASLVFDDRGFGINQKNSAAITNFFLRSAAGAGMDAIVQTPFFAISQSHNIGLQLADFVTSVIALHYAGQEKVAPYFEQLRRCLASWPDAERGVTVSSLKIIHGQEKAPGRR